MGLQLSGDISLSNIQTEFGGSNPISISEYYSGGGIIVDGLPLNAAIPSSGAISLGNFYNTAKPYVFNATISSNVNNYVVNTAAISAGWNGTIPLLATITINSGITVGSTVSTSPAFLINTMPLGSIVNIINNGIITGAGGLSDRNGGTGIQTSVITAITNNNIISGGGGGGGNGTDTGSSLCIDANVGNGGNGGSAIVINANTTIVNNNTIGGGGGGGGGGGMILLGGCGTTVSAGGGGGGGGRSYSGGKGGARGCYRFCSNYSSSNGSAGADGTSSSGGAGGFPTVQNGQAGGYGGNGGSFGSDGTAGEIRSYAGGSGGLGGRAVTTNAGVLSVPTVGTIYGAY
jgi:hypothetical protein